MLISPSRKFGFIADLKTASTSIEKALRPYAELALVEARFGWMLGLIHPSELLVFRVMRDPIDYVVSLYNSHMDQKFKENPALYMGDLDFDRFLGEWAVRNDDQVKQQYFCFLDKRGRLGANYIISYQRLEEAMRFVGERTGVKGLLPLSKENQSHGPFDRRSLKAHRDWIEVQLARARDILNRYCDRLLSAGPRRAPNDSATEGESTDASANSATAR